MQYPLSAGRTGMPAITTGAVIAVAGVALALLALRTAHAAPELGYAGWSPSGAAELILPGLVALGVALESLRRHARDRTAVLLALAAVASFLPELSVAGTRPAAAFTAGLALAWATPPLVAHLALLYPGRPLPVSARAVCDLGYFAAIAGLGVLPALVFDPVAAGCGLAGATPAARRLLWPVLVPAAVIIGCFAIELAVSFRRAYLSTEGLDRKLWLGGQAALVAIAVGFAARWLRTRRARTLLARDVVELSCGVMLL